ncbi:lysozyme [Trabulsiella odontotermitis]|uniref:lysozyme n=1 Tax=Trabulsiella odontotermitis TaxID=379893 RepID=UPI0006BA29FA|nr:lysozyme [Trabulsiella odontotermitis]
MAALKKAGGAAGIICSVAVIISIVLGNGHVRTNERGLELIGNAESCRRDPYVCPAGVLTDGMGNTHGVKQGTIKNDQQIAAEWEANILDAESCVNRYGNGRNLSDDTFSAAVSVTFRSGCGNMRGSTMFSLFRSGDLKAACNQFSRWVFGGGRVLPGLVTRAGKEETLCLDGVK